jgi:hypothetical protein
LRKTDKVPFRVIPAEALHRLEPERFEAPHGVQGESSPLGEAEGSRGKPGPEPSGLNEEFAVLRMMALLLGSQEENRCCFLEGD